MSERFQSVINEGNVSDFIKDLGELINKYKLHSTGPVTLNTSHLNFRATSMNSCPCPHLVELCDIHHQNCTVKLECKCGE